MREIKFKAYVKEMNLVLPVLSIQFDFKKVEVPATYSNHIDTEYFNFEQVELIQYTGLKDSKGNEIYEGDIVKISDHPFQGSIDINGNYEVYYNEYTELSCGGWYLFRMKHYAEVIGNKFENRNLLKGADKE
ncbi:YopX family protein [Bacillus cereus group sp. MYBK245-2]|uniref:YopX family protein n=1 Tax=unclassified Bacillus cereus group TaxID=2750818 RepID=UPI003F791B5B